MTIHFFTGPTLDPDAIPRDLDATVSGPAAFGDVCRAAMARPTAIAIIDGYFEKVPAVWHKEILWTMSEGVHVFGCSSMGALRAAELSEFGMEGIGAIYEAYRRNELEDDDEVAVVHSSADDRYAPLSDAMVNIRVTLRAAREAGIIGPATCEALLRIAKAKFYAERTYASVTADALLQGLTRNDIRALREWLPSGRIDQKRSDALLLVSHLREWLAAKPRPKQVAYRFEPTDAWHEASRAALAQTARVGNNYEVGEDAIAEELKIAGVYQLVFAAAAARGAAVDLAARAGMRPDGPAMRAAAQDVWRKQGLRGKEEYEGWCKAQRLDEAGLARFINDQARVAWAQPLTDTIARSYLSDELRAIGEYSEYRTKAEAKARRFAEAGSPSLSLADTGLTEPGLWTWYFLEQLHRPVPDDLEAYARSAGFAGKDELRVALIREVWCARLK
jgi:hypothetical protein